MEEYKVVGPVGGNQDLDVGFWIEGRMGGFFG
jgi:hypothetical protein